MSEGRSGFTGDEFEPRPGLLGSTRAVAEAAELARGLRQFRVTVREYRFDPPVRAMFVRRGSSRWLGVAGELHPAARRAALLEVLRALEADPNLLFHLVGG